MLDTLELVTSHHTNLNLSTQEWEVGVCMCVMRAGGVITLVRVPFTSGGGCVHVCDKRGVTMLAISSHTGMGGGCVHVCNVGWGSSACSLHL